ncbi:RNA polymerase sigma factor [Actinacidiphila oryziradicis]|uniref:Sigma-70 family RNA polymerase sigma factor n=1 Tax=Actinacidiphila oryziradicis TaxID=2571141 RepID=A0A4U0RWR2_9ACTN|nr:sigma-70 family RNA polymerase sigma factor [Actinacidiphila oryziradicis]TKA00053.1 sigma-70 family RNA polymerase sigma factor [Actinacidiphila oryziradicis]
MTMETYRGSDERWQRMWRHREQLLKVARRRSMSREDAEDAVHEAMLRAVENPHIDDERLGAWLTTVTVRLCADRYRQVNRETEVGSLATHAIPAPATLEESVCDRAEAVWLARQSGELPARQAEALRLKSQDLDVEQVASHMGLSYRAAESLLARARRALRQSLAATFGFALWVCGRVARPRPEGGGGGLQAAVSTAATLTVLGLAVPYAGDAAGPQRTATTAKHSPRPTGSGGQPDHAGRPDRPRRGGGAVPASPSAGTSPGPRLGVPVRVRVRVPVPVPDVSMPPVSQLPRTPAVPTVPAVGGVTVTVTPPALPDVPGGSVRP